MRKPLDRDDPETLEKDPVWDLLAAAPPARAEEGFAGRVMEAARGEAARPPRPRWRALCRPRVLAPLALGACAALALLLALPRGGEDVPSPDELVALMLESEESEELALAAMDEELTEEVLALASADPTLLVDEELVDFLY